MDIKVYMVPVWVDKTGELMTAQLTCTITHAFKGQEDKVAKLRKPVKLKPSMGSSLMAS